MAHSGLIPRIDSAIKASLPFVHTRFDSHLNHGGVATLLRSASHASIHDYRAVGEIAVNKCILLHFLRSETPYKHRGTITARILSPGTLQLLVGQSKRKSDDFDAVSADPADTVFIFVGALAASQGDVAQWFEETFVPMIDSAASEYAVYLEELPKLPAPEDGASPPKRMRHDNDKRKLAEYSKAVDDLTAMAASLSGKSTESGPDTDYLEELQVLTILNPAALVEGLRSGPFRSATSASLPATLDDDYSEEQEVLTLLDPPGLGQAFGAVSSSVVSGVFVSLRGAAQETARWIRAKVVAFTGRELGPFKQAAFPDGGQDFVSRLPWAVYESFVADIQPSPERTLPASPARLPPSFRRSCAPSPPSPLVLRHQVESRDCSLKTRPTPRPSADTSETSNSPHARRLADPSSPDLAFASNTAHSGRPFVSAAAASSQGNRFRVHYQQGGFV